MKWYQIITVTMIHIMFIVPQRLGNCLESYQQLGTQPLERHGPSLVDLVVGTTTTTTTTTTPSNKSPLVGSLEALDFIVIPLTILITT